MGDAEGGARETHDKAGVENPSVNKDEASAQMVGRGARIFSICVWIASILVLFRIFFSWHDRAFYWRCDRFLILKK